MRVLVCGGRDFHDRTKVYATLDRLHAKRCITIVIQGAADGADRLAAEWGWDRGIMVSSFPADWQTFGRAAGHKRNQQMLDEGKPDGVIAFPGGAGTADMIRRAEAAGIKVWQP